MQAEAGGRQKGFKSIRFGMPSRQIFESYNSLHLVRLYMPFGNREDMLEGVVSDRCSHIHNSRT